MELRHLHEGWTLRAGGGPVPGEVSGRQIPADVPGCVSTDLMAAGLLPDPYLGTNQDLHAWVGRCDWSYETRFEASRTTSGERADLVFFGLDTVATVRLNGKLLGTTANMHRSHRFDVSEALLDGANVLVVHFEAPVTAAERMSEQLGPRPHTEVHPFNAIRKMACNFGWDWGPDLATAGIWRPVGLERWRLARIASVRPLVQVDIPVQAEGGPLPADASSPRRAPVSVQLHVALERADLGQDDALHIEAEVAGKAATVDVVTGESAAVVCLDIPDADLWWPAGYGAQPLHQAEVRLKGPGGELLGTWQARLGFRSVELDTADDERGSRLGFVVNGRAVQVRGANWIPEDCFPSRVGRSRYRRCLEDARGANVNLLRVWGGGIYEDEDFYELADELGIMVWQDFMLACAAYAEEEPLRSEIEAEAREALTRLAAHPSVVAWSGCNENIWGYEDWGWKPSLEGKTWGAGYYFDLFPSLVSELDPSRPYMAGSPWSFGHDAHPNDPRYGSVHVWDVWNSKDYTGYRDWQPQFVAEFGFQGPPAWATLVRALDGSPLDKASPVVAAHQKQRGGIERLDRWVAMHFPEPGPFEDWHWATSLNQARAVGFGVEHWRSLSPTCRGTVLWQLNDCWPVMSWAVVDGDGLRKPVWYALRKAYSDLLLTIQPGGAQAARADGGTVELAAVAVNDGQETWSFDLEVTRRDFYGAVLATSSSSVLARPGERARVVLGPEALPGDPAREVLVVEGGGHRALWFYREDKELDLPAPALDAHVEPAPGGYDVVVTATTLQRDVAILADRADPSATSDEMLFTLLPGESRRVRVTSSQPLGPEQLLGPGVLCSANQLVHRSKGPR
jgi:beta-mannosidase